jgi:homoserine kinase
LTHIHSKLTKGDSFELSVPASVANLGPGFDTLAVAVQLYLHLHVQVLAGEGELRFEFVNEKLDGENYIERAFRFLANQRSKGFPSLAVEVRSEIPMKSGLGSSAAATVAGLRLFEAIAGPLPAQGLLNAACALENHPDNVAAALLGGLTLSCQLFDRSVLAVQMEWPANLELLVSTPRYALSTHEARGVLPERISREDAVFNLQHIALLLHSLQTGRFALLREALQDRMHQPFRESLVPGLERALGLEHPDLLGVCLSGAGPSVVAFAQRNFHEVEKVLSDALESTGIAFTLRRLRVHQESSRVSEPNLA